MGSPSPFLAYIMRRARALLQGGGAAGRVVVATAAAAAAAAAPARRALAPRSAAVAVTGPAAARLRELLASKPGAAGVRIGVKTRGCNGVSYTMTYAEAKVMWRRRAAPAGRRSGQRWRRSPRSWSRLRGPSRTRPRSFEAEKPAAGVRFAGVNTFFILCYKFTVS